MIRHRDWIRSLPITALLLLTVLRCDPLKLLIQFLTDKNIRPVDLFRLFDKDKQYRVSREQFVSGLKVVYCYYLHTYTHAYIYLYQAITRPTSTEEEAQLSLGWPTVLPHSRRSMQKLWCIHANRSSRFLILLLTKKLASRHRAVYSN